MRFACGTWSCSDLYWMMMRAEAALLVCAMLLSPLTWAVCELRCAPPAAFRLSMHTSCHEAAPLANQRLDSQARHCSDRHVDDSVAGMQASKPTAARNLQIVSPGSFAPRPAPAPAILSLHHPPGQQFALRATSPPLPLRI